MKEAVEDIVEFDEAPEVTDDDSVTLAVTVSVALAVLLSVTSAVSVSLSLFP